MEVRIGGDLTSIQESIVAVSMYYLWSMLN
jgi:hypothetical protein